LRRRTIRECRDGKSLVIRIVIVTPNPSRGKRFWGWRNYINSSDKEREFIAKL